MPYTSWKSPLYADADGDSDVDVVSVQMLQEHWNIYDTNTFTLTFDRSSPDLARAEVMIDTDRRTSTGCDGFGHVLEVVWSAPQVIESSTLLETPDCSTRTPAGEVRVDVDPPTQLALTVDSVNLAWPQSFDWAVVVEPITGTADRSPDAGTYEAVGWRAPYIDVPLGAYFTGPAEWMRATGLSTGVGGSIRFEPARAVSRAEMATFVHRIAGEPAAPPSPFTDVPRDVYYTAAVDWLYAEGISTGVGGTDLFGPDQTLTRGQMVTLLWRWADEPGGYADPTFSDVSDPGAFYFDAVAWAQAEGITTGIGGTNEFRPDDPVTRGQLATFLQRVAAPLD